MAKSKIVITGATGFIGKNLSVQLRSNRDVDIYPITRGDTSESIQEKLAGCDVIFHLAGANRPEDPEDFTRINVDLTRDIIELAARNNNRYKFILASSIQAERNNPYGISKKQAEKVVKDLADKFGFEGIIYRLPNVFGKWGRPNYNSVVTTFCYNISRGLEIHIDEPDYVLPLVYIDDLVNAFISDIDGNINNGVRTNSVNPQYHITVNQLACKIKDIKELRASIKTPRFNDDLIAKLYATYLSYLPENDFSTMAHLKTDDRGRLFELVKQEEFGQVFVSSTKPGVTRGNHFHHTKTEKFCVIQGKGLIRFRPVGGEKITDYRVDGSNPEIVDIPPGYTHNITNTGREDMITLFWASEIFDEEKPDTIFDKVE